MKREVFVLNIVYIFSIILILFFARDSYQMDNSYKVVINRIHQQLTDDSERNAEIVEAIDFSELGDIQSIELINTKSSSHKLDDLLNVDDARETNAYFKEIENSDYLVKYTVSTRKISGYYTKYLLIAIASIAYIFVMFVYMKLKKT